MATSYGIHHHFKGEFDPQKRRAPWDELKFICGQNGARAKARPYACGTHGMSMEEGCRGCEVYVKKYQENFKGCGKVWTGGEICWTCHMKKPGGEQMMITVMPKVEYLRFNEYTGYIPPEVLKGRDDSPRA